MAPLVTKWVHMVTYETEKDGYIWVEGSCKLGIIGWINLSPPLFFFFFFFLGVER